MIQRSVDYKNFNVTLEEAVKALQSLKQKNLELFADNKDSNKKIEKIKKGLDQSIVEKYDE